MSLILFLLLFHGPCFFIHVVQVENHSNINVMESVISFYSYFTIFPFLFVVKTKNHNWGVMECIIIFSANSRSFLFYSCYVGRKSQRKSNGVALVVLCYFTLLVFSFLYVQAKNYNIRVMIIISFFLLLQDSCFFTHVSTENHYTGAENHYTGVMEWAFSFFHDYFFFIHVGPIENYNNMRMIRWCPTEFHKGLSTGKVPKL